MRLWRPVRSLGGMIGCFLALTLWVEAVSFALLVPGPVNIFTFWYALGALSLFFLGGVCLYWGVLFFTLRYTFDRNGITLRWGGIRQVIPMNRITAIRWWKEGERVWQWGLTWPGYHRGRGRSPELGKVSFYATAGRRAQILVCTPDEAYVLSPRDPQDFVQEMGIRRDLGITRQLSQETQRWWIYNWSLWRDPPLWVLGVLALGINVSLFAFLCYRYPALPQLLPIHYVEVVEEGQIRTIADVIGRSQDLFKLPAFGLLILGGNTFLGIWMHRRHRLLVLLLAVVALVVQVSFWLGALYVLNR